MLPNEKKEGCEVPKISDLEKKYKIKAKLNNRVLSKKKQAESTDINLF